MTPREAIVEYYTQMYNYAFKLTGNPIDAEDLTQDTCIKVLEYGDKLYVEKDSKFKYFMLIMLKQIFINTYKRKKKHIEDPNDLELFSDIFLPDPSAPPMMWNDFNQAISILSPIEKEIFTKRLEGFKYHEIANMFNINIGTIKSKIWGLRSKIKPFFSRDYVTP